MERAALSLKEVYVIGGGLGGLAAACRLAGAGFKVTILEQQATLGGKLQRVELGNYLFDRGPSTITMKDAFERVFQSVGKNIDDYLTFYRIQDGTRNFFPDGTSVDFVSDMQAMETQIASYCPEDARQFRAFMAESKALYEIAEQQFMNRLLLSWTDFLSPALMRAFMRIRPLTSLHDLLRKYFKHPHTLAMFGRYATYVGADPYQAPAIFAMLPYVELQLGVYGVRGGTYSIVQAMTRLAEELGVDIRTNVRVHKIVSQNKRVVGLDTSAGYFETSCVIANGDVLSICKDLITEQEREHRMPYRKIESYEPSLSGFVVLAGVAQTYEKLLHHTVFFPERYADEFTAIFRRREAAAQPTLYICNSSATETGMAPKGKSNLFILANAPYVTNKFRWEERELSYRNEIVRLLEVWGLDGLRSHIEVTTTYTPENLMHDTSAHRGAIYGISSNTAQQTFFRPRNNGILEGLWFVGGTTHPGGGTPMVTRSGHLVAEHIIAHHT